MKNVYLFISMLLMAACQTIPANAAPISFELPNYMNRGEMLSLDDYAGEKVVIEFYFADCPACNQNAPQFKAVHDANVARAKFVEVSIDCGASDYQRWVRAHAPTWPVLNDCGDAVSDSLSVRAFPTTIVLDRNHNVAYRSTGVWTTAVRRRIETLLGSP